MEAIEMIEFAENLKDDFKKLNFEWLEKFKFKVKIIRCGGF